MASNLFKKAPIEMPNKSGFDMSHENFFTAKCGSLTPCMVDFLLPNDTVSLGFNAQIQLPPMATDFYGEVVGKYELFFVPYRIVWGRWKSFIENDGTLSGGASFYLPEFYINDERYRNNIDFFGSGSLLDMLGYRFYAGSVGITAGSWHFNILPLLCYHKIYDDWYRDARLTNPCFYNTFDGSTDVVLPCNLPWASGSFSERYYIDDDFWTFYNGHKIYDFWQRNFPKDYFTNCSTAPQAGDPASLSFSVDGSEGSFTIAGLRAANSLQMFMERNNMAGNRYQDRIKVQYDIYPSDAVVDRAIYLGSGTVNVYTKSVFQSSTPQDEGYSTNPFNSIGSKYGSSQGVGGGTLCKKFTATEHGILMCIFSLVPRRYYWLGCRKQLCARAFSDIPFPSLAGVGDQEVNSVEVFSSFAYDPTFVFGYSQRYSEYKFMNNEVHGLLRYNESLSSFCLQDNYSSYPSGANPTVCTEFIQIPTDYMDGVCATVNDVSKFGCWNDTYFEYKKVSTLPAYSIPTLENMKHSHVENVNLGGTRL